MTLHLAGAAWVLPLAAALLALSGLITLYRLLRGPSRPDRAVAIDALTLLAVAAMALLCLMRGEALFIDVAVLLALVSFLGTAAFAFLFDDAHSQMPEKREERP
ncbi:monovalent cation/H+ antiporter complex subunit F [Pseudomonas sp. GD03721]|nr:MULTISPECIES: monovalent cation/H+ antiporter complex subunit F [unclassified Pseudomonas]MDH1440919.1 monovalent cation/H+ antiporter complex subunit F [Pseudomonas sp. GD03722]WGG00454.1 monovalent cation/H+ antiporter complex subunit F [Pseudomonas sp. GD03721]WGG04620.1 monovalent cation/H+ antiporter complex subunit F [Pseudomonas sp. GD03919]WGL64046.1 monovalent cation/H+ antiporter complex subunit F [Pseudomonas sp. CW003PS]